LVYVMLSRVCTLEQIYILNKFDEAKMYPNTKNPKTPKPQEKCVM
jgi:hypothetical protein